MPFICLEYEYESENTFSELFKEHSILVVAIAMMTQIDVATKFAFTSKHLHFNFCLGSVLRNNFVQSYFFFIPMNVFKSVLLRFQVDLTRVNEFGDSGDMLDDPTKAVEGETPTEQAAITHSNGEVPKSKADKKKD